MDIIFWIFEYLSAVLIRHMSAGSWSTTVEQSAPTLPFSGVFIFPHILKKIFLCKVSCCHLLYWLEFANVQHYLKNVYVVSPLCLCSSNLTGKNWPKWEWYIFTITFSRVWFQDYPRLPSREPFYHGRLTLRYFFPASIGKQNRTARRENKVPDYDDR